MNTHHGTRSRSHSIGHTRSPAFHSINDLTTGNAPIQSSTPVPFPQPSPLAYPGSIRGSSPAPPAPSSAPYGQGPEGGLGPGGFIVPPATANHNMAANNRRHSPSRHATITPLPPQAIRQRSRSQSQQRTPILQKATPQSGPYQNDPGAGYVSDTQAYRTREVLTRRTGRDKDKESKDRHHHHHHKHSQSQPVVVENAYISSKTQPVDTTARVHHHHHHHHSSSNQKATKHHHHHHTHSGPEAIIQPALVQVGLAPLGQKVHATLPASVPAAAVQHQDPARQTSRKHKPSKVQETIQDLFIPEETISFGPVMRDMSTGEERQSAFRYSKCTGRRKALCIGINYLGSKNALQGCINDARNVRDFLIKHYHYPSSQIILLTDDARSRRSLPTRENMLNAMRWLVKDAQPDDSLFFHYSGHGGQVPDKDGDEDDGFDEIIFPLDYKQAGYIVDDDLFQIMVKPLPMGCRLTAIFDSCHSGSALDLPFMYNHRGQTKGPDMKAKDPNDKKLRPLYNFLRREAIDLKDKRLRFSSADAISWSGCKDSQTSADTVEAGRATGAMSYAFIKALSENEHQSYQQLLVSIRKVLGKHFNQKPQLSSSHPIHTNVKFIA